MKQKRPLNRRRFLKTSMQGALGAGIVTNSNLSTVNQETDKKIKIKEYRTLGRTGFKVSDISYGAGFLSNANVFEVSLDMGINYIDTGEHYGNGQSERIIGQVVKNRDRKKLFITTKLNMLFGGGSKKEDILLRFHRCLERLQTNYVDCLMVHMTSTVDQVKHEGFHSAVKELKAEGKVRFIGLSNHGIEQRIYGNTKDQMEKVLLAACEDGRFDVALFVYNFLQKEQGEKIIRACKAKNMGITLMKTNPVAVYNRAKVSQDSQLERGRKISDTRIKLMEDYKNWITKAEEFKKKYGLKSENDVRDAATKFVLSNPDVHAVCPTMNTFDELETFVKLSGQKLRESDHSMLQDYETKLGQFYCRHSCGICESACPNKIPVNTIMRYNHYFTAQRREKQAMEKYIRLAKVAEQCQDCSGHCVNACPYNVPIQGLLTLAHENLSLV
jgi:uncharacterized protein